MSAGAVGAHLLAHALDQYQYRLLGALPLLALHVEFVAHPRQHVLDHLVDFRLGVLPCFRQAPHLRREFGESLRDLFHCIVVALLSVGGLELQHRGEARQVGGQGLSQLCEAVLAGFAVLGDVSLHGCELLLDNLQQLVLVSLAPVHFILDEHPKLVLHPPDLSMFGPSVIISGPDLPFYFQDLLMGSAVRPLSATMPNRAPSALTPQVSRKDYRFWITRSRNVFISAARR